MNFSVTKCQNVQRTTRSQTLWCCFMLDGFCTIVTACSVNQLMGVLETFWLDMWIIPEGIHTATWLCTYIDTFFIHVDKLLVVNTLNKKAVRYIKKTRVGESIGQEQKLFYEEDRNFGEGIRSWCGKHFVHFDLQKQPNRLARMFKMLAFL